MSSIQPEGFEGVILRGNHIVVPESVRKQILKLAHETHQGIVKTKQFLCARFFWPGMDQDVETLIKGCSACVVNQPLNRYTPLQPTPLPRGPWIKGAVDLVGRIDGKHILTYIDHYSSYPEACIIKEITSREVIKALTAIFARFGYPDEHVSNNGKQFISAEFDAYLKSCGIQHIRVSPYYACSNGKLERFHRYLKKNFRAAISEVEVLANRIAQNSHALSSESASNQWEIVRYAIVDSRNEHEGNSHCTRGAKKALDREHRAGCESYQHRLKSYHDAKQSATPHDFRVGDVVFCANMKPNTLDSKFSPAEHAIIKSQGRDTFSVVNVSNVTTLVRNAKYLKHAPTSEVVTDSSESTDMVDPQTSAMESSESQTKNADACLESDHSDNNAVQNDSSVTTRSGRVVKSTKDLENFVYF
ncbi:uncharacterized protein K02A2.6-like [Stylophora pistillata]|uniref:uncharacterized protein K02A2.6-like n=1 Tax=Stylophora pistillata TaxID=50429 RepID=UPI000C046999|nr:uncharacterized protein K02A2.6-like [Stylophora pistillata]